MRPLEELRKIVAKFASSIAPPRRSSRLYCGDCEQSAHCGLPPDEHCAVRAEQIDHNSRYGVRRPTTHNSNIWPV